MLNRTRKAFTMIELIVVIVILGILALIAIPTYNAVIDRTRKASVQRTAEAVGREAVALAAFTDNQVVTSAQLAEAKLDVKDSATVVGAFIDDADGVAAGNQPGFTVERTYGNKKYTATVAINGTVVKANETVAVATV